MVLACVLSLRSSFAQNAPNPVTWSLAAKSKSATVRPGGAFDAQLTAQIDQGWHVYSLDQPDTGPVAMRISVPMGQHFELQDEIEAPQPRRDRDSTFGGVTEFYEGTAAFTLPIHAVPHAPAGRDKLRVEVTFQACSKQFCLLPQTVKLELPVEVSR